MVQVRPTSRPSPPCLSIPIPLHFSKVPNPKIKFNKLTKKQWHRETRLHPLNPSQHPHPPHRIQRHPLPPPPPPPQHQDQRRSLLRARPPPRHAVHDHDPVPAKTSPFPLRPRRPSRPRRAARSRRTFGQRGATGKAGDRGVCEHQRCDLREKAVERRSDRGV